jgi:protein TonB
MPATPTTPAKVKAEPTTPKGAETKTAETTTPAPHASHAKPAAQSATKTAKVEPAAQPSAEAAKPHPAAQASSSTKPKPSAKPPVTASPEQEAASEPKPGWTPMALAPADKDTVGKPKVAPKRSDAASYNAKIWSALARHKPRIGKSGSATVTFSIGAGGGLRSIKVSGSSGDSQLDQMAIATVRGAAPFPPPPDPASASYTIRIYFR